VLNFVSAANVIFENELDSQSCSTQSRGTFKYTTENTLEICTGEAFKPVKGGKVAYSAENKNII